MVKICKCIRMCIRTFVCACVYVCVCVWEWRSLGYGFQVSMAFNLLFDFFIGRYVVRSTQRPRSWSGRRKFQHTCDSDSEMRGVSSASQNLWYDKQLVEGSRLRKSYFVLLKILKTNFFSSYVYVFIPLIGLLWVRRQYVKDGTI